MSDFKRKIKLNSSKYSKVKNKKAFSFGRFCKKMFFLLLLFAFLGVCGWVLLFSDYTEIKEVKIVSQKIDKDELKEISDNLMVEKWFEYLPKNNFFLFPRKTFIEKVKNDFKLARNIKFENKFPDKIKIEVEERQGVIIWCSRNKCWLLDEKGEIFYLLQPGEKEGRFKKYQVVVDDSYLEIEEKQKIKSEGLIKFIKDSKNEIEKQFGLKIEREIKTPALVSREIRFKVQDEGWEIYLNLDEDFITQIALLKEVLESSINSKEREQLNYIDLRISGKAIYNSSFQQSSQVEK